MPYKRDGALKYSDHQVQTPLAHVNLSCQSCHNCTESEILARVDEIRKRTKDPLGRAETVRIAGEAIDHARQGVAEVAPLRAGLR